MKCQRTGYDNTATQARPEKQEKKDNETKTKIWNETEYKVSTAVQKKCNFVGGPCFFWLPKTRGEAKLGSDLVRTRAGLGRCLLVICEKKIQTHVKSAYKRQCVSGTHIILEGPLVL